MSIAMMTEAWRASIPAGRKLVLLSLCDNANDQGECYPSISMIAERCSLSERAVQGHIKDLQDMGCLRRIERHGRSTIYRIDPRRFCTPAESAPPQNLHPTPAESAPPPPQNLHPTPAESAPITVKEPSIESSRNQKTAFDGRPEDVSDQVWADFSELRKAKRSPLTATAVQQLRREAASAGMTLEGVLTLCCLRGWTGFKAAWVEDKRSTSETTYQRSMRERMTEAVPEIARPDPNASGFFKAVGAHAGVIDVSAIEVHHEPARRLG